MMKLAIIAAMERELEPLVEGWTLRSFDHGGTTFSGFETDDLIAVVGGIGGPRAELAARAVVEKFRPQVLISAGFAGALIRSLKVASVVTPNVIVDGRTGTEYRCQTSGDLVGGGVLVSAPDIADADSKAGLAERFHALVVDMEAATIAKVAEEFAIGFRCVKAISDEFDFFMPPMAPFVDADGGFRTRRFAAWALCHPRYWPATVRLARNSHRAAKALADWLRRNLKNDLRQATVVTLGTAEHLKT